MERVDLAVRVSVFVANINLCKLNVQMCGWNELGSWVRAGNSDLHTPWQQKWRTEAAPMACFKHGLEISPMPLLPLALIIPRYVCVLVLW